MCEILFKIDKSTKMGKTGKNGKNQRNSKIEIDKKVEELKEKGYEYVINQLDLVEIKQEILNNSTNPRDVRNLIDIFIVDSVTEYILNV